MNDILSKYECQHVIRPAQLHLLSLVILKANKISGNKENNFRYLIQDENVRQLAIKCW
jgi:hypothetical protein